MRLNTSPSVRDADDPTPLPTRQIVVLMLTRLAEPISYTVIFPFINQMISETGVTDNPDKVGFYSGLVESVFAFVQFFTVYHWAKLSDRIGRKPVIILGLLGVCISISLFGFATSFPTMLFYRCLAGALNGNVAVVKAAIGDLTDDSNSTEAFALFGLTWTVGAIIGNALGGTLSHPYENYPSIFGGIEILRIHPYLLPCVVSGLITLLGVIFAQIFYTESRSTLQLSSSAGINSKATPYSRSSVSLQMSPLSPMTGKRGHRSLSSVSGFSDTDTLVGSPTSVNKKGEMERTDTVDEGYGEGDGEEGVTGALLRQYPPVTSPTGAQAGEDMEMVKNRSGGWGFWDLMRWKPMRVMCMTMFLNSFMGGAWAAVSLLFFYDKNGGLNMSTSAIGAALSINGLWTIACQLLLLNRLRRWLGVTTAYKVLTFGWMIVYLLLPRLRLLMEWSESPLPPDASGRTHYPDQRSWATSIGVNAVLSFVTVVGMNNSLLMVLVNYSSPDRSALGAVNGISTAVGCMARVIGPSLASALFAISMDGKVLGGNLWWIAMCIFAGINFVACLFVAPEAPAPRRQSLEENLEEV